MNEFPTETTEATILTLFLTFALTIRVRTKRFFKISEVFTRQWSPLAQIGHIAAHVVNPDFFRVARVSPTTGEEVSVGLHSLRVENSCW